MKICVRCKNEFQTSDFGINRATKDGLNRYCKKCNSILAKEDQGRNPERVYATKIKYQINHPEVALFLAARTRARKFGLPFDLEKSDIVIPKVCPYLEVPFDFTPHKGWKFNAPSVDRIVPELGYTKVNIEIVSSLANRMKSNATPEQMIKFAEGILKRNEH